MMEFIDHGDWVPYVPDPWPPHLHLHHSVLFCKRVSDDRDWYDFQRKELKGQDTVKMTLLNLRGHWQVQASYHDASMIFPAAHKLIEIKGNLREAHENFRRRRFDLQRGEFLSALPHSVMRLDLLRTLFKEGLLDRWEEVVENSDRMTKLSLLAERPLNFDDPEVVAIAEKLGLDEARLIELFEDTINTFVRTDHG